MDNNINFNQRTTEYIYHEKMKFYVSFKVEVVLRKRLF